VAESDQEAKRLMDFQAVDVMLLVLKLPGVGGIEVLRQIKARRPDIEVVVMTSHSSGESAVQAIKAGAYDYITKPFGMEQLRRLLDDVSAHLHPKTESRARCENIKSTRGFGSLIGRGPEMDKIYRMIAKAAYSTHPVLIFGETGTGKEMVARAIHHSGPFRDKRFIPVGLRKT